MDNYTTKNISISPEQLFFKINNKQVMFKTDKRTVEKLNDEDALMNYVEAIINSRILISNGQNLINYPVNISRTDNLDMSSSYIQLIVLTIVQDDGVEKIHCGLLNEISNEIRPIDLKSIIANSNPIKINSRSDLNELCVLKNMPALKWSTEMTSLLIALRGSVNDEFNSSKYKFKLWELIATRMNSSMPSVKVTAKDCDNKWKNIAATYRKNVKRIKCMSDFNVRWEHFAAMDEILKATDELKKPDSFIEVDKMIVNVDKIAINNNIDVEDDRSYDSAMTSVDKKYKSHRPYFYDVQNMMNSIGNENVRCVTPTQDIGKSNQPPEWFFNYMKRKEVTDTCKYEKLRSMITDLQHSQIENRRLILSIVRKL